MAWLRPVDGPDVVYEFFSPFAHVPGRYEACRIRSPTHGAFDCLIALGGSTSAPATVYVNDAAGQRFMQERYPECKTVRVAASALRVKEIDGGRRVTAQLRSTRGPVRRVDLTITAKARSVPRNVPYGGEGRPVWGGRWTCWGVDLVLAAVVTGSIHHSDGRKEMLAQEPALVTLGSFVRIAPR